MAVDAVLLVDVAGVVPLTTGTETAGTDWAGTEMVGTEMAPVNVLAVEIVVADVVSYRYVLVVALVEMDSE